MYRLEKGVPYYDLENYYDNNKIVRIPADIMLTPPQNSQKYYKEYRKKQVAESKLNEFINEANDEADYFESVIDSQGLKPTAKLLQLKLNLLLRDI